MGWLTGVPIRNAHVRAYDHDKLSRDDFMAEDYTDDVGNYVIVYKGKNWDRHMRSLSGSWRPDIYIKASKTNWCTSISSVYDNHKMRRPLYINLELKHEDVCKTPEGNQIPDNSSWLGTIFIIHNKYDNKKGLVFIDDFIEGTVSECNSFSVAIPIGEDRHVQVVSEGGFGEILFDKILTGKNEYAGEKIECFGYGCESTKRRFLKSEEYEMKSIKYQVIESDIEEKFKKKFSQKIDAVIKSGEIPLSLNPKKEKSITKKKSKKK